jgi:hypothetical protein
MAIKDPAPAKDASSNDHEPDSELSALAQVVKFDTDQRPAPELGATKLEATKRLAMTIKNMSKGEQMRSRTKGMWYLLLVNQGHLLVPNCICYDFVVTAFGFGHCNSLYEHYEVWLFI